MEKGENIETSQNIVYNTELSAPLKKGDVVGKIEIINNEDGKIIGISDLIVQEDIYKSSFVEYLKKILKIYLLRT